MWLMITEDFSKTKNAMKKRTTLLLDGSVSIKYSKTF